MSLFLTLYSKIWLIRHYKFKYEINLKFKVSCLDTKVFYLFQLYCLRVFFSLSDVLFKFLIFKGTILIIIYRTTSGTAYE